MAYRRKGGAARASTFEEFGSATAELSPSPASAAPTPSSLTARAIQASSAYRDSSLSSVYGQSAISSAYWESNRRAAAPDGQATPPRSRRGWFKKIPTEAAN